MDATVKRQDPAAFPANTKGNGVQQESHEEEPSSAATPITVEQRRNARDSGKMERALPAQRLTQLIEEFVRGIAPEVHEGAGQPEQAEQKIKALQSQPLSSVVDEITSDGLLRLALKKHLSHIDRLEEIEKQSKKPRNDWARDMHVLISAAAVLQKYESVQKPFDAQVQTRCPIPEPQLSKMAQRLATLSPLDRQLIIRAGMYELSLLENETQETEGT